ncbi:DUF3710 domain-containing protein [Actinomyces bowdenii]|uniref:DUF3710 domain-containing protein n=1 Tax=Actinomyces bowdenii TaxID=131109 RepID=A0A3P1V635_9ACTO|nr:DUF3710 domain-containing protein [Actinomyces bowdenii]MBO3725201.1 DUF3710 domain-containing protein [Actinomyces bowdenii]RRD29116.1 DUF3710 domain-containing protein [Actinomyces bowdenii]
MGLFSRRDKRSGSTGDEAADGASPARGARAGRSGGGAGGHGPWDSHDLPGDQEDAGMLDLGSLRVPAVDGMQLRLEQARDGSVTAVVLALGGSALELRAFAAPRSTGIWEELRSDIARELSGARAAYEEVEGEHGTEILAHIPMRAPDGTTSTGTVRFIGIDGPRWFLRGVLQGPAAGQGADSALREVLRGVVVVRDKQARPPREILPLHAPGSAPAPEAEELPGIDPISPGPTIAEVR